MAVNATAVWRVRPSGANTNGGGYDAGISSPGTDYSQQNSPQVTFNGSTVTATGTTATLTLTGYTVAATDVANCLQIASGTNFTAGFYFITSVNVGSNTWTLDRNPVSTGTGSAMVGRMGGGWADFWTNGASVVAGNTIYILGSGVPNPSSYTFDYTYNVAFTNISIAGGSNGLVTLAGDPATPSSGVPCITFTSNAGTFNANLNTYRNLWLVVGGTGSGNNTLIRNGQGNGSVCSNLVIDQNGFDMSGIYIDCGVAIGCEVFSSVAPGSAGSNAGIRSGVITQIIGCNIHDTVGPGILISSSSVVDCIIAKCRGYGINLNGQNFQSTASVINNTIDGNTGNGIELTNQNEVYNSCILNNIISNHTTAATYGLTVTSGTQPNNDLLKLFIDYNVFYNNTTNYNAISAGAHDTALSTDPYVAQSTEDYTLA